MAVHDFGTVRAFETNGLLELSFQRGDAATMAVAKSFRGRWDPNRKVWRIDPKSTNVTIEAIVDAIRAAILETAPEPWRKALPGLVRASTVTRRFGLMMGAGGTRLRVPNGHNLEYALKKIQGAVKEGQEWIIPATFCADQDVKKVINDLRREDKTALGKMIDFMDGFGLAGKLNLVEGEAEAIGIAKGEAIYALPSFVRKADASIEPESLIEYPMRVVSAKPCDVGLEVLLAFVTGVDAWQSLTTRYGIPSEARSPALDSRHVWLQKAAEGLPSEKWSRKRV